MQHNFTLEGAAFRLRPIGDADAALVLELRGNPDLSRYLHPVSLRLEDQLAWLTRYYERDGDFYFVIERRSTGTPEGVISIYDIRSDPHGQALSGEWGRWILKPGSPAAVESAWLIYRCAFEQLGLTEIFCRTVANNQAVVSFHDSCGISDRRLLPGHFRLGEVTADAVEHRLGRQTWPEIEPRLKSLVDMTARRLQGA